MTTRPEILFSLFAPVDSLSGVGGKTKRALTSLGITRVRDVLYHLPRDGRVFTPLGSDFESLIGHYVKAYIRVGAHTPPPLATRMKRPYRIQAFCADHPLDLVFFIAHSEYLSKQFQEGQTVIVRGKLEKYADRYQIMHPEKRDQWQDQDVEPIYPLGEGVGAKLLSKIASEALWHAPALPEWIHESHTRKFSFPSWKEALETLHHPKQIEDLDPASPARMRLAYDEILSHQLASALIRSRTRHRKGRAIFPDLDFLDQARRLLPYALTGAQERALGEILSDLEGESRMFRLLQGDVGSGKTAVAFLAACAVSKAGYQVAFLAPTEILAKQHHETLGPVFSDLGIETAYLTGGLSLGIRREIAENIQADRVSVIFGTHAIFQEKLTYANLGLVIIDEQHRFGVRERQALVQKGMDVDLLSMSATPIPRSLAMVIHGEMLVSILDEKPKGRQPIQTSLISSVKIENLIARLSQAIKEGRQVYWVCPLIEESEKLDFVAAKTRHAHLAQEFAPLGVGLVHGRMRSQDKIDTMQRFTNGEISVLVATTAIEVGVDVPNASIMIIEGAERFGLAQLHQLRGRVGRGDIKSDCLLLYSPDASADSIKRLELLRQNDDGFYLAEADLKLRGPGDFIGTAQSGAPDYQLVDFTCHMALFPYARDDAKFILAQDPALQGPRGTALRLLLYLFEREQSMRFLETS